MVYRNVYQSGSRVVGRLGRQAEQARRQGGEADLAGGGCAAGSDLRRK